MRYVGIIMILFVVESCSHNTKNNTCLTRKTDSLEVNYKSNRDTIINFSFNGFNSKIVIKYPDSSARGTILVLHGWNLPLTDWCDSTTLCQKALQQGYILVFPDFGKSIYSLRTYPETRTDWLKYPTRNYIKDTLFFLLQNEHDLFKAGDANFIIGLSTGARGAALFALDSPDIFSAVACLSGDYDQALYPNDNLYKGFFGDKNKFKDRYIGDENIISRINEFKVPIYLGHGEKDEIVPVAHTLSFYKSLKRSPTDKLVTLHIDSNARHDYNYWNSEVDNILLFFKSTKPNSM